VNQVNERIYSSVREAEETEVGSDSSDSLRLRLQDAARSEMKRRRSSLGQLTGEQARALEMLLTSTIEAVCRRISQVY
jgi:hypothetical protein